MTVFRQGRTLLDQNFDKNVFGASVHEKIEKTSTLQKLKFLKNLFFYFFEIQNLGT